MLTESNFKILKLKLNRYKIAFDYNVDSGNITLGKAQNMNQKLILGILGLSLAVISLLTIVFLNIPYGRIVNYVVSGGMGFYGTKKLYEYFNIKETSEEKTIHTNGITIENQFYPCDEILDINYEIEFVEDGNSIGQLYVTTIKKREKIITLIEKEYNYLKNDLEFLKTSIIEHLDITLPDIIEIH